MTSDADDGEGLLSRTETHESGQARAGADRWARLVVVHPAELASVHAVAGDRVVAGREGGEAELPLAHRTVSRSHAELRREGTGAVYSAVDLGSRNGTWLDGVRLSALPRPLHDGAVLRLGGVIAVFEQGRGEPAPPTRCSLDAVPGVSAAAGRLRAVVDRLSRQPAPALVIGESGVGKESIAHELHRLSEREGPMVVTNCAALSGSLVESQLFGHERGAFTGAVKASVGLFRAADGGSLFLDEVGELPVELQPKLLRAVERGEVQPLGETRTHRVATRVIAATNQPLSQRVEEGAFRRDLYARLSLAEVVVPPLRARRADIPGWLARLHTRWASAQGEADAGPLELSAEAMEVVLLHPWTENLRGLDRLVHALGPEPRDGPVAPEDLPPWLHASATESTEEPAGPDSDSASGSDRPPKPDKQTLLAALEEHAWNINAVARHFQRNRKQVYRWLSAFDIPIER